MYNKSFLRSFYLFAFILTFLNIGCEKVDSFGEDLEVAKVPGSIAYPDIRNAREFSKIVSAVPFIDANGHSITLELLSIKKGTDILDDSYMSYVSIGQAVIKETTVDVNDVPTVVKTTDLSNLGVITIADGNPFGYGDYYFTIKATSIEGNGSAIFTDAFHLFVGPDLADGIAYCPFNMNFVSGASTTSEAVELFGGNAAVRYELGTEADKLSIDPTTGAISLNPSYTVTATETLTPTINVISTVTDEVMSFDGTFTAVLSTAPVVLNKQKDYFFFPTLRTTAKKNVGLGGAGYSRVFVEHKGVQAGDPEETTDWYITNALWKSHKNAKKFLPPVPTADAVAVRGDAGVSGTTKLLMPFWTIVKPTDTWIVMDPVNLALYEGCFETKAVFWYNLYLNQFAGYELDGSTPIGLEVYITNNYTGDTSTTSWTQVNDILECEINNNGNVFTGTPYPGDQSGIQPPSGVKDLTKNANNLWVRSELNLENYKTETKFTIAFRVKTYFNAAPNLPVNGNASISNVHFLASEK